MGCCISIPLTNTLYFMSNAKTNTLWVEKYRPSNLDTYIGNEHIKGKISSYISNNDVPHLLLHGKAGTGKSTAAKILINSIDCDYMIINASDENNVDTIRNKIKGFASSAGFRSMKIVMLDEADYLTTNSQAILRNLMEEFSAHTRFILTCNYVERIIEPIQSRCQVFQVFPPDKRDVAMHVSKVLSNEGVAFEPKNLAYVVNESYPDIRKIINTCQSSSVNGTLVVDKNTMIVSDYKYKILNVLKSKDDKKKKYNEIRQILVNSKIKDFTDLYTMLYETVDQYAPNNTSGVILALASGQLNHVQSTDKEIPTAATLIEILNLI